MTKTKKNKIILASASPRRKELFSKMHIDDAVCEILPSNYEESLPMEMTPEETVMYLSFRKALEVASRATTEDDAIVIGSDTIVVVDGEIYGKPADEQDAYRMLKKLSGRSHFVITGLAILNLKKNIKKLAFDKTEVRVRHLDEDEIWEYIRTVEPMDKAGAYAIQGEFADHISSFKGSYDNVVGLPTELLSAMLGDVINS